MFGFLLGCVVVACFRTYAFHGTNPAEFVVDLAILLGVTLGVNFMF